MGKYIIINKGEALIFPFIRVLLMRILRREYHQNFMRLLDGNIKFFWGFGTVGISLFG